MNAVERQRKSRDSLYVLARMRFAGDTERHPIRIRNVSAGGLMAECAVIPRHGELVLVELKGLGWMPGTVCWVQDHRFGIALSRDIDPRSVLRLPPHRRDAIGLPLPRPGTAAR
jgi:hypothetical protein